MAIRKRSRAKREAKLRPDALAKEAQAWRRAATRAHDPAVRREFEAMAEDREIVAGAIAELESEARSEEPTDGRRPEKSGHQ